MELSLRKSTIISSIVAIICLVIMMVVTITNVRGLTESVQNRTYNYLRDVSEQSAEVVQERLAGRVNSLRIIGNSIAYAAVASEEEFLGRKLAVTEFDELGYVRPDGSAIVVNKEGSAQYTDILERYSDSEALNNALYGESTAGFFDDYVAFMEPVTRIGETGPGSDVLGVMIGVRSAESLQNLLVSNAFAGSGFTFIVDQYGGILPQPMPEENIQMLTELVTDALQDIPDRAELSNSDALDFTVETADGTTLLMDYQPLYTFGWAVVTAVNENFLGEAVNKYVTAIIITLVVFMTIFAVLLLLLIILQRRYQKRLEAVAFVDPLTGGKSFIRFRMLAEPLIQRGIDGDYALGTLNVKRFKLINRLGGSREGDDVLRHIYGLIESRLVGPDEMVAHNTADNFVLLLHNDGEEVLRRRLSEMAKAIEGIQTVFPIRVSQGVYVTTADPESDFISFLDRSNSARMSTTQEYQSTLVFYNDDFIEKQEQRMRMIGMIEQGLRDNEFTVYLQPKVDPNTSEIVNSEALVRWIHPKQGMIGPNVFIPLCEQHGLICDLDLYVFEKVCAQLREWMDKGWKPVPVSVNVSGMHLKDVNFVQKYRQIADKYRIDPALLELELTESVMFSDLGLEEARAVIDAVHEYGFKCSMDDFGSGYSALGLLTDLPIDIIKLDRSFFIDSVESPRAQTVIATIIRLAQELDIETVAEGIETIEQVDMLRGMGVDMIQGFYYSRPLPMAEFAAIEFEGDGKLPVVPKDDKNGKS